LHCSNKKAQSRTSETGSPIARLMLHVRDWKIFVHSSAGFNQLADESTARFRRSKRKDRLEIPKSHAHPAHPVDRGRQ
jgi:hypothetical protein